MVAVKQTKNKKLLKDKLNRVEKSLETKTCINTVSQFLIVLNHWNADLEPYVLCARSLCHVIYYGA